MLNSRPLDWRKGQPLGENYTPEHIPACPVCAWKHRPTASGYVWPHRYVLPEQAHQDEPDLCAGSYTKLGEA